MSTIGLYAKAVVSAVAAALTTALTALSDNGGITPVEWVAIGSAFVVNLGALAAVTNTTTGWTRYLKAIIAGAVAALGSLGAAWSDGSWALSTAEVITLILAVIATVVPTVIAPEAVSSENLTPRRAAVD